MVYEASLELILAFNWPSEASWKAAVIKYDFREGSEDFGTPRGGERKSTMLKSIFPTPNSVPLSRARGGVDNGTST